jgi:hypothetical protein
MMNYRKGLVQFTLIIFHHKKSKKHTVTVLDKDKQALNSLVGRPTSLPSPIFSLPS